MEYIKVPFDINLFREIIKGRKACYKIFSYPSDNTHCIDYIGYDKIRDSYIFYHYFSRKYIDLKEDQFYKVIYIAKIVPEIGSYVKRLYTTNSDSYYKVVEVTKDNLNIFKKYDDWEPVLTVAQQLKYINIGNLDLIELSDTDLYLYADGWVITRNKSYRIDELPKELCIISVWSPAESILSQGLEIFDSWDYKLLSNLGYECIFNINEKIDSIKHNN